MRYEIFCQPSAIFTGHLHSTPILDGARSWKREFERQGYTDVYIIDRETGEHVDCPGRHRHMGNRSIILDCDGVPVDA